MSPIMSSAKLLGAALAFVACASSPPSPPASSEPASTMPAASAQNGKAPHEPGHNTSEAPICKLLAHACHPHDKDSEKAHACHVLGHRASTNEECEAKRVECLTACVGDAGP
jgi:hypothetical protein